ncbi:hypothetical protein [Bacillus cereus]|uniref:hypothetical protein n=1 Tax=Bacillus cereus TaxID=1396 RepID=UPI000BF9CDFB|nr:hypothetical protein [Bacillus cereus]PFJ30588.1 hypothetical protein COI92_06245 [Bacillus anthracis]PGW00670.1 hypothetical protein COD87_30830 [Bacillus cereus]
MESTIQGSFDCCHLWYKCNYGKKGCEWGKTRPEKPEACSCFKRNNKKEKIENNVEGCLEVEAKQKIEQTLVKEDITLNVETQLSLF